MKKYFRNMIVVLIALAIFFSIFYFEDKKRDQELEKNKIEQLRKKLELEQKIKSSMENLDTLYSAVSVYDMDVNKEIYGKHSSVIKPLASLVKTMTVITALETNTKDYVRISPDSLKEEGGYNLVEGEIWNIKDLSKFTLILSSNDGASALTRGDVNFLDRMNKKAKSIGTQNTFFSNVTGLDMNQDKPGAYGTALDSNKIAIYALKNYPEVFESTTWPELRVKSESGFTHNIKNTNLSINRIPGIMFSKTGFTQLAGGNLTIIFKNAYEHNLAVTLLGSTMEGRFSDMEKIVNALYNLNYNE